MLRWERLNSRVTPDDLGLIPSFLDEGNPAPAKEQFDKSYCAGWHPFEGFKLNANNSLSYPGDPITKPLAQTKLRDELIVVYEHAWVAIIQPDRSFEVCRMD